jgi:5-methylcytosine-specific restriction endonuclease McrA
MNKTKEAQARWRDKNREKIKIKNVKFHKEYQEKYPERKKASCRKWYLKNVEHRRKYRKKYFVENKEKEMATLKRYRESPEGNPIVRLCLLRRKAREKNLLATLTIEEWGECLKYFDNRCAYCGEEMKTVTVDHFVPVVKNGSLAKSNIVPACKRCNSSKGSKTFDNWYPKQEFYNVGRKYEILNYLRSD